MKDDISLNRMMVVDLERNRLEGDLGGKNQLGFVINWLWEVVGRRESQMTLHFQG